MIFISPWVPLRCHFWATNSLISPLKLMTVRHHCFLFIALYLSTSNSHIAKICPKRSQQFSNHWHLPPNMFFMFYDNPRSLVQSFSDFTPTRTRHATSPHQLYCGCSYWYCSQWHYAIVALWRFFYLLHPISLFSIILSPFLKKWCHNCCPCRNCCSSYLCFQLGLIQCLHSLFVCFYLRYLCS